MKITEQDNTTFADLQSGGYFKWQKKSDGDIFFKETAYTFRNVTRKGPEVSVTTSFFQLKDLVFVVNSF